MRDRFKKFVMKTEQNYRSFIWFVAKLIFWFAILTWLTRLLTPTFISTFKPNNVTVSDFVLFITAAFVIAYTYETQKMKDEIVHQSELKTMPILSLYVRRVSGIKEEEKKEKIRENYAITHEQDNGIRPSNYYIAIRNMGEGPAFNVDIESVNFKAERYQTKFYAPNHDEHAVKLIKKPSNKIRKLDEFSGEIFAIKCKSVFGKSYEYRYRIKDIETCEVEFI